MFAITAAVYGLYLIRWRTRLMQIGVLVLVTSLHSRNILIENGGDVIFNILALWTVFLTPASASTAASRRAPQ